MVAETGQEAPKKKRAKRNIIVLEKIPAVDERNMDTYQVLFEGFDATSEAVKWVKDQGESLIGKTLMVVSAQSPRKVRKKETKPVITF